MTEVPLSICYNVQVTSNGLDSVVAHLFHWCASHITKNKLEL